MWCSAQPPLALVHRQHDGKQYIWEILVHWSLCSCVTSSPGLQQQADVDAEVNGYTKQAATWFKLEGFPGGIGVPFTGRGRQPSTPETNFPCSETRPCRISKPSVSKGKQKCCYLLHNTSVLIRALISSQGKLKSGDIYKTHTLSHTHTEAKHNQAGSASSNQEKNNCRNSVKSARWDQLALLCQWADGLCSCSWTQMLPLFGNSSVLHGDNSGSVCHLVLSQTITWLNGNILIMQ